MQDRFNLKRIDLNPDIHSTAVVHPFAKIGRGVKIGPFSIIGEHVVLGDGCVVGSHVSIDGHTTIGKNNKFFHGASIGADPQDLKYDGHLTHLEIGDDNTFREFATAHRGSAERGKTVIRSRCFFMAYSHVAHDCVIGDEVVFANSVTLGGHVNVDDFVTIGGLTAIHQFVSVGRYAFLGGGSKIERDVPPYAKAAGSPFRVYGVNSIGLERRGFSAEKRAMVKRMFNVLYRSDLNVSQVLLRLMEDDFEDPERKVLVDFLNASKRGIAK